MTKKAAIAEIKTRLAQDVEFVEQALVIVFNNRISDEQAGWYTKHLNGRGFTGLDADFLTGFALRIVRGGHLTEKQLPWAFKKMPKYAEQVYNSMSNGRRADVQRLRARASTVITGSGTVVADDPRLTARDPRFERRGRRPLRVVLDTRLRTPPAAHVLSVAGPTLILTRDAESKLALPLREAGASVEAVRAGAGGLDLDAVLARLAALECNEVLVEAGPTLDGEFLRTGLVDEVVVYMAPVVLGHAARSLFNMPALERMCDRCAFQWRDVERVGEDLQFPVWS